VFVWQVQTPQFSLYARQTALGTWIPEKSVQPREVRRRETDYLVIDPSGNKKVTEAEFFGGKGRPPDPPGVQDMFRPRVSASYFGLSGVSPVGCFIVSLLYKLAWDNRQLRSIVWDMLKSGLIRAGGGKPHDWPIDILPPGITAKIPLPIRSEHWDEWACDFCSMG